jgi:adenylate kinase family enzyme
VKKIAIIGCGGSGKSTLSLELGQALSLPVHHLDMIFWKPNWTPMDHPEFLDIQSEIFAEDEWIVDGNYGSTMEQRLNQADTIIFLDLPTLSCLRGAVSRFFKYRNQTRPDMTEGNEERLNLEFLLWILFYRRTRRPAILSMLDELAQEKQIVILTSREAVEQFVDGLAKK